MRKRSKRRRSTEGVKWHKEKVRTNLNKRALMLLVSSEYGATATFLKGKMAILGQKNAFMVEHSFVLFVWL